MGKRSDFQRIERDYYPTPIEAVIDTPIEAHSKKPDEVRDKIVLLCGDKPRIELFARQKHTGWDAWGNEVESSVAL